MNPNKYQLSNGTRVVVTPIKDISSVTIMVLVAAGSRHEGASNNGVAHYIEHTFFKGSTNRPSSIQIAMDTELMGANSNAFTSYEYTGYYIKVPKDNFKKSVEILADMLLNPLFSEEELDKERGVIIEEIRMYEDIPRERVRQSFMENVFKDNPLAQDIAGTVESMQNMHRDELLNFVDANYNSSNIVISIAGSVTPDEAMEVLNQEFAGIQNGSVASFEKMEGYKLDSKVDVINDKTQQTHLIMGSFANPRKSPKRYAEKIGNSILSYGFGASLFQVIREQLGLAYYVGSRTSNFSDIGLFSVSMGVNSNNTQVAVDAVINELVKLSRGEFSDQDLERAKNYLIGNYTTELEATDDIAQLFGLQELLSGELESFSTIKSNIEAVTREDIINTWQEIIVPDNFYMSVITDTDNSFNINFPS